MGIIGVLAGIAIPQYAGYKQGGFDGRAQIDMRNVATAEEAYFVDHSSYVTCNQTNCGELLPGLQALSPGVVLEVTTSTQSFSISASHPQGSGEVFHWNQGS